MENPISSLSFVLIALIWIEKVKKNQTNPRQKVLVSGFNFTVPGVFCKSLNSYYVHFGYPYVSLPSFLTSKSSEVVYSSDYENFSEIFSIFSNAPIIGLDCEWKPEKKGSCRSKTAVVQLACNDISAVFHVFDCGELPFSLKSILENPSIAKVGIDIANDAKRLFLDFGVKSTGLFDLRMFSWSGNSKETSLKHLCSNHLGILLDKSDNIRCSDWSQVLNLAQISYAALDAYSSFALCDFAMRHFNKTEQFLRENFTLIDFSSRALSSRSSQPVPSSSLKSRNQKPQKSHKIEVRKTALYDNCRILAPDGQLLSTCSQKKVDWYLEKGLAVLDRSTEDSNGEGCRIQIRLLFEPRGRNQTDEGYYLNDKENCCVVCGMTDHYLRHHIVPTQYKQFFPELMKAHLSHDVVLLCVNCHREAITSDVEFSREWAHKFSAPISGLGEKFTKDRKIKQIKSYCSALLGKQKDKLPADVEKMMQDAILNYFPGSEMNVELLQNGCQLNEFIPNPQWISHGELVVSKLMMVDSEKISGDEYLSLEIATSLATFIRAWRRRFLEVLRPKYLPCDWSVDNPVFHPSALEQQRQQQRQQPQQQLVHDTKEERQQPQLPLND